MILRNHLPTIACILATIIAGTDVHAGPEISGILKAPVDRPRWKRRD